MCDPHQWCNLDGNSLAALYDETISTLLDRQIPVSTKTCRRRPSNLWFDDECRTAKRSLRSHERAARRVGPLSNITSPAVVAWLEERRRYFDLVHRKRSAFWTDRVEADQNQPRRLWQSFDELLGRGRTPLTDIDACRLHRFFDDKVEGVRAATAGAAQPVYTTAPAGCELRHFTSVKPADVIDLVRKQLDKQCSADPMPTWLLKSNVVALAPFLSRLFN